MQNISPAITRSPPDKPKAVFFDLCNTLVTGTSDPPHDRLARRLSLTGKQAKKAGRILMTYPAHKPAELAEALEPLLADKDGSEVQSAIARLWVEQESSVREIEGASGLLEDLKRSGLILGLISNTWRPYYQGFRRECPDMAGIFDFTLLSFELGIKKPSLQFFEHALAVAGTAPSDALVVGDSFELDIEPARTAGCRGAWVLFKPEKEKRAISRMLRGDLAPPEIVAEDIRELGEILRDKWL